MKFEEPEKIIESYRVVYNDITSDYKRFQFLIDLMEKYHMNHDFYTGDFDGVIHMTEAGEQLRKGLQLFIINELPKLQAYLKKHKGYLISSEEKNHQQFITPFEWAGEPKKLILLNTLLVEAKGIQELHEGQFSLFFNLETAQRAPKVEWLLSKSLLAYFISSLFADGFISNHDYWAIAENVFEGVNRKSLGNLYQKFQDNKNKEHSGKPKNFEIIDRIILSLKSNTE